MAGALIRTHYASGDVLIAYHDIFLYVYENPTNTI